MSAYREAPPRPCPPDQHDFNGVGFCNKCGYNRERLIIEARETLRLHLGQRCQWCKHSEADHLGKICSRGKLYGREDWDAMMTIESPGTTAFSLFVPEKLE